MKHRLNLDIKDPNYILLKKIFKIIDSRKSLEILASYRFKNLNKQIFAFKIIFISMFFGLDISFILNELESKKNYKTSLKFLKFQLLIMFTKFFHNKTLKTF